MNKKEIQDLVTIGILCFNAENTILKALKGAFGQDWENLEVVVVDDFSSDNSVELITKSEFFNKILFVKNKNNMGPAYSRNVVLSKSKGDFVCFMDDDDFSDPYRISTQVESIMRAGYPREKNIISTCGVKRRYSSGYVLEMHPMGSNGDLPMSNQLADYLLYFDRKEGVDYGFASPTCSMLATRSCFNEAGYFDANLRRVEDMDLTIRFSLKNFKFISTKKFLVFQESSSGSDKTPLINLKSEIRLIKKYKNYLKKKGMYFYSILWPYLRYYHFRRNYPLLMIFLILICLRYPNRGMKHFFYSALKRFSLESKINNFKI